MAFAFPPCGPPCGGGRQGCGARRTPGLRAHSRPQRAFGRTPVFRRAVVGAGRGGGPRRTQIADSSMRGLSSISLSRIVSSTPSRLPYTSSLAKRRMSNPCAASAASRAISSFLECVAPSPRIAVRGRRSSAPQGRRGRRCSRMTWRRNRKPATCSRRRPCQSRRSERVALRRRVRARGVNDLGMARPPPTLDIPRKAPTIARRKTGVLPNALWGAGIGRPSILLTQATSIAPTPSPR